MAKGNGTEPKGVKAVGAPVPPEAPVEAEAPDIAPTIVITLNSLTGEVAMNVSVPDSILVMGMLELAKVAFLEEMKQRGVKRILTTPSGLKF